MSELKSIRTIEYSQRISPPMEFQIQAKRIFLEKYYGEDIYTAFAQKLARDYIPGFAEAIPDNPFRHPVDTSLSIRRMGFGALITPLADQLSWVLLASEGAVQGKRILDLGCGSTGDTVESKQHGYLYEPWLCRTLLELGAQPIGVDYGVLDREKFETLRRNLLIPGSLDVIPDDSIDIVHTHALFNSPQRSELGSEERLKEVLEPQIFRVLKPNGVLLISHGF